MQLLGEADDGHEEQQHHGGGGADGDAQHLELGDDRLAAGAPVPHVVLDVAPTQQKIKCEMFDYWEFLMNTVFLS